MALDLTKHPHLQGGLYSTGSAPSVPARDVADYDALLARSQAWCASILRKAC